ncbi:MAG: translational GTPase TypA [Clostridia bacterium]|nr:translational GTPase TypA [Clostridia bacterium]
MYKREDIRNVAIIAHVDHGKTTLIDAMLKQSGIFRKNEKVAERVMDSNDLERERGITILSKNASVKYKDKKINIIDTPGHADFGGEVERVLKMVNGVLLLVDAFEGPMPQTRFVLRKALQMNLKPIVVVNKIDRPDQRTQEVVDEIIELFIDMGVNDDLIDFPICYVSAKNGIAKTDINQKSNDLSPLFDLIINEVPFNQGYLDRPFKFLVSSVEYDEYLGRVALGRVEQGAIHYREEVDVCKKDGSIKPMRIAKIFEYQGMSRVEIEQAKLGDIIAISGIEDINIGETICAKDHPDPIPFVDIDEPTISMMFSANTSPFAGTEGEYVTSRHLRRRLYKEVQTNISMRVEDTDSPDAFKVSGRGELHLSILIETMRREGYEFQVSKPEVIYKMINGKKCEPIELLYIEIPEEFVGTIIEKIGIRKGEMKNMHKMNEGRVRLEFEIPSRGLIGFRSEFLTDTKGNGILNHVFDRYEQFKGDIAQRQRGSLVSFEAGEATTYGLYNAQERGLLFIAPGTKVYQGMVVGENARSGDIDVNVCKKKHVSNMRAAGSDEALKLVPPIDLTLEQALEFINNDELVEITPENIRIRKKLLNREQRLKLANRKSK